MRKTRPILKRVLSFVVWFSALPLPVAILASVFYRGGGLRASSSTSLSILMWRANSRFVAGQFALVALGTLAVAAILGLASLLAWDRSARNSQLRVGRFV